MSEDLESTLIRSARRHLGSEFKIQALERLSGGASASTWRFDLVDEGDQLPAILQLAAGARYMGALSKTAQAQTQASAHRNGILTPEVLWILEAGDPLGEGYVSRRVEGETLGKRIVGDALYEQARAVMPRQCGEILADIHALPRAEFAELPAFAPRDLIGRLAAQHRAFGEHLPVFELAIRWLHRHLPASRPPAVLHGDFRTGNFLVNTTGIAGVLDWELSHIGDPMEDLGWLCMNAWRFDQIDLPVGGFGERAALYEAYEAKSGVAVDHAAVHFWELYGTLQWGVICQYFAFQHLRGEVRSLERAVIGRRVSEVEFDLLQLMEP
jgi:aminoglycoside phosphotransferase (APT) family kinase protein